MHETFAAGRAAKSHRSISKFIKINEAPYTNCFNQQQHFTELHTGSNSYFPSFFPLFCRRFTLIDANKPRSFGPTQRSLF
jgi:hypothetical protein